MANKIDITISAKDEASDVIDGVKDSFGELEGSADTLEKTGSKSFGDFMDNVAIAMLGINQAIEVGMKVAEAAKRVYDATVGKAVDVAGEIEELMRVSGDAPETLSALRLEAEKAAVPFDDLYKAMQNLNKNGIAPTVDNLVAIADEYVNLKDPLEKAKLLTENFGEAGDEIAPMLEAIAGGVKNVQGAMPLFTEEDIQNANNYTEALANFEIAKEGFLVKLGQTFLPSITEVLQNLSGVPTEYAKLYDSVIASLDKALTTGAIKWNTYKYILNDVNSVTGTYSEQVDKLNTHLGFLSDMTGDSTAATEELANVNFRATSSIEERSTANLDLVNTQIAANEATALAAAEQEKLEKVLTTTIFSLGKQYTPILEDIAEKQERIAELESIPFGGVLDGVWVSAKAAKEEIAGLTDEINASTDAMKTMAAQAVAGIAWDQIAADGKLTMDEIGRYYDFLVNTGVMSAEAGQLAAQNLMDVWAEWDPEMKQLLLEALLDNSEVEDYEPTPKTLPVKTKVDTTEVDEWDPPTKNGTVNYQIGTVPRFEVAAGGAVHAAASGVAASLPHYWVGELGPEPFFPAQNGRIVSNTQAMSALRGGTNAGDIADAVKKGVKEAMRDGSVGSVYNLTMPTSSNPADIRMAFELMEAWGT